MADKKTVIPDLSTNFVPNAEIRTLVPPKKKKKRRNETIGYVLLLALLVFLILTA